MADGAVPAPPPQPGGIAVLADRYDGLILDVWGVLYDGGDAFPDVVPCLEALKHAGKRVLVLSNAPRPPAVVERRLRDAGIPRDLYDEVLTSGAEARRHLEERPDAWHRRLGRRCFDTGGGRFADLIAGLDLEIVDDLDGASFILATGPADARDTLADYETVIAGGLARGLPLLCCNPDREVIHLGRRDLCAGAIAEVYAERGGDVMFHGKPHRPIYEVALARLGIADRRRVMAVGDNLDTDIAGADGAGIDSVLVATGIHARALGIEPGETPAPVALADLLAGSPHRPTAFLPGLRW